MHHQDYRQASRRRALLRPHRHHHRPRRHRSLQAAAESSTRRRPFESADAQDAQRLWDDQPKADALLKCWSGCLKRRAGNITTDISVLKPHYEQLLHITRKYRPQQRGKRVVYRDYLGPRLEDYWINGFLNTRFSIVRTACAALRSLDRACNSISCRLDRPAASPSSPRRLVLYSLLFRRGYSAKLSAVSRDRRVLQGRTSRADYAATLPIPPDAWL